MSRSRTRSLAAFGIALVAAVLAAGSVAAQTVTGSISGTVVDPQKSIVPGATVTIVNEATSDSRAAVTDDQGHFQVTNLQPGSYTARVELTSFRTFERKNIVLSAGERLSIGTIGLEVGSLGETVTVEARGSHSARSRCERDPGQAQHAFRHLAVHHQLGPQG